MSLFVKQAAGWVQRQHAIQEVLYANAEKAKQVYIKVISNNWEIVKILHAFAKMVGSQVVGNFIRMESHGHWCPEPCTPSGCCNCDWSSMFTCNECCNYGLDVSRKKIMYVNQMIKRAQSKIQLSELLDEKYMSVD